MDSVELVMAWEEEFNVELSDKLCATLVTPRHAAVAIEELLRTTVPLAAPKSTIWWKKHPPRPRRQWTREQIEEKVCEIIVEQIGISRKEFTLDSHFIRDMGVD